MIDRGSAGNTPGDLPVGVALPIVPGKEFEPPAPGTAEEEALLRDDNNGVGAEEVVNLAPPFMIDGRVIIEEPVEPVDWAEEWLRDIDLELPFASAMDVDTPEDRQEE